MAARSGGSYKRTLKQSGKPCVYCARTMNIEFDELRPTRDHVEPRSKGGRITVWCCSVCNQVKRDMTVEQWALYRLEHDFWWLVGSRAEKARRWVSQKSWRQSLVSCGQASAMLYSEAPRPAMVAALPGGLAECHGGGANPDGPSSMRSDPSNER